MKKLQHQKQIWVNNYAKGNWAFKKNENEPILTFFKQVDRYCKAEHRC
jgi:hypothetical protein